jgi:hypothetical protein
MRWWIPAAIAGAGLLVLGGSRAAGASGLEGLDLPSSGGSFDPSVLSEKARRVYDFARHVEDLGIWTPGFAEFAVTTSQIESGHTPNAMNKGSAFENAARGLYQIRPESAFSWRNGLEHLQNQQELLFDPAWSTAIAADYAKRLVDVYAKPGQTVTWADLRRGWKYPKLVSSDYRATETANRNQFLAAIDKTTQRRSLADEPAMLGDWPGVLELQAYLADQEF